MIKCLLLGFVLFTQIFITYGQLNIKLVGELKSAGHGDLSDIWGHVDATGKEYALVGYEDGNSIIDISNPASPVEVFFTPETPTTWRDLKVWNDHVYITSEGGGGLTIIDLSNLPGTITAADVHSYTGVSYPFTTSHDIYIDENGYAYVMGADFANGGAIILDLNIDPKNPVEVGVYDDYYLHDGMVRGDTLWAGAIDDGFFVAIDVSDKTNPITMQTQNTPSAATHNCWISDDGHTLFTTDEVSNAFITSYDVSDLSNITELDRIQSSPGELVVPHNTFVLGDYIVTSYYRDGVTIHDVSNPSVIIEVGSYDTSPAFSGGGFNGCWGVYPYLPSGLIIASDVENGLLVLEPTYSPASYLDGNVTDSVTKISLGGVKVKIDATTTITTTNILGNYQTGYPGSGTYDITYSKFGYESKTIKGIALAVKNTVTLNVELKPLPRFVLQGQVLEAGTGNPISLAKVKILTSGYSIQISTDADGNFSIPSFVEGLYEVYIGKWGREQLCLSNENLTTANNPYTYQLDKGYYDDFTFNWSWIVTTSSFFGRWETGEPNGTLFSGDQMTPEMDVLDDCSDQAFVTGNTVWDFVIDGVVTLKSPFFDLSTYSDPYINYSRWFYNYGDKTDSLIVKLSNGISESLIDFAEPIDPLNSTWQSASIRVLDFITLTSNMKLSLVCKNNSDSQLVEAGFDKFEVIEKGVVGIDDKGENSALLIYPNPFNDVLTVRFQKTIEKGQLEVYEITGKLIETIQFKNAQEVYFRNDYKRGIYFLNVYDDTKLIKTEKVVKF